VLSVLWCGYEYDKMRTGVWIWCLRTGVLGFWRPEDLGFLISGKLLFWNSLVLWVWCSEDLWFWISTILGF